MNYYIRFFALVVLCLASCAKQPMQILETYTSPSITAKAMVTKFVDNSSLSDEFYILSLDLKARGMLREFGQIGYTHGGGLDADYMVKDINSKIGFDSGINSSWTTLRRRHNGHDLFLFVNASADKAWLAIVGY